MNEYLCPLNFLQFGPLLAIHASILLVNPDWSGTDWRLIKTRDPTWWHVANQKHYLQLNLSVKVNCYILYVYIWYIYIFIYTVYYIYIICVEVPKWLRTRHKEGPQMDQDLRCNPSLSLFWNWACQWNKRYHYRLKLHIVFLGNIDVVRPPNVSNGSLFWWPPWARVGEVIEAST